MKKYILGLVFAVMVPFTVAYAATPTLTVTGSGDNNNVTVRVTGGEINAPVVLFYNGLIGGNVQQTNIGTTDINGNFTGTVSTSGVGINWNAPVYVQVGGYQSQSVNWPYTTASTTSGTPGTISGSPILSQSSMTLGVGGQGSITLSGGTTPYSVIVPTGSGISTTLVGNTLFINGNNATPGTAMLQVCSTGTSTSSFGACTPIAVTIQGQGQVATTTQGITNPISFVLPMTVGQTMKLSLLGGSGSYFLQSPSTSPITANISGGLLTLTGTALGQATYNVCSTGVTTMCTPIGVTVSAAMFPNTGTGGGYFFENDLSMGMTNQDVMELQNRLKDEGYFNATATGYFGPLTASAVRAYQSAHGISAVGVVGPATRAALNQ